jgi:hypothetical protein
VAGSPLRTGFRSARARQSPQRICLVDLRIYFVDRVGISGSSLRSASPLAGKQRRVLKQAGDREREGKGRKR